MDDYLRERMALTARRASRSLAGCLLMMSLVAACTSDETSPDDADPTATQDTSPTTSTSPTQTSPSPTTELRDTTKYLFTYVDLGAVPVTSVSGYGAVGAMPEVAWLERESVQGPLRGHCRGSFNGRGSQAAVLGPVGLSRLGRVSSAAGFLSRHEVVVTTTKDGVFVVDVRDGTRTLVQGVASAKMVSSRSGLLIGGSRSGHGIYNARTGEPVLGSPTYRLVAFNPTGEIVVGRERRKGQVTLVMVNVESGDVVQAFRWRTRTGVDAMVWENNESLLVPIQDFVRMRVDGQIERAPSLSGGGLLPPLVS